MRLMRCGKLRNTCCNDIDIFVVELLKILVCFQCDGFNVRQAAAGREGFNDFTSSDRHAPPIKTDIACNQLAFAICIRSFGESFASRSNFPPARTESRLTTLQGPAILLDMPLNYLL